MHHRLGIRIVITEQDTELSTKGHARDSNMLAVESSRRVHVLSNLIIGHQVTIVNPTNKAPQVHNPQRVAGA